MAHYFFKKTTMYIKNFEDWHLVKKNLDVEKGIAQLLS